MKSTRTIYFSCYVYNIQVKTFQKYAKRILGLASHAAFATKWLLVADGGQGLALTLR